MRVSDPPKCEEKKKRRKGKENEKKKRKKRKMCFHSLCFHSNLGSRVLPGGPPSGKEQAAELVVIGAAEHTGHGGQLDPGAGMS